MDTTPQLTGLLQLPALALMLLAAAPAPAAANEEEAALATQLANPIANLISVPFQGNYDGKIGPDEDGEKLFVNFQPVIPFTLNQDWNLISRTILPITWQDSVFPGAGTQFGFGNTRQSLFFSPSTPSHGILWGAGPIFLVPTHTEELLGLDTWGVGPTAVGLWQGKGWTVGILANQIWSVAGDQDEEINAAYLQPFISYTTPNAWTFAVNSESTYDWDRDTWSVPINVVVSKLVKVGGKLPVSIFGGVRYWVDAPEDIGPEGWGARFGFTLLLPRNRS